MGGLPGVGDYKRQALRLEETLSAAHLRLSRTFIEQMAARIRTIKGKAIISINDHPAIRDCFRDFHVETTDINYTVGGGKGTEARELLIFSWDVQAEPAGLF